MRLHTGAKKTKLGFHASLSETSLSLTHCIPLQATGATSVKSGGLDIEAGGLKVGSGGAEVSSGGLTVEGGLVLRSGTLVIDDGGSDDGGGVGGSGFEVSMQSALYKLHRQWWGVLCR